MDIPEECRRFAQIIRNWGAPRRITDGDMAATFEAAADEIEGLRHDLSRHMDALSQAERTIDLMEPK